MELLRSVQVLFFIQQAGLINEIFDKDCPPESRMAKLEECLQREGGIIDLPRAVRVSLVYSCTSKSGGKNEYTGEFVVKHIATADYVVAKCDVGTDGENWAEQCTKLWTTAKSDKRQDFADWHGQGAQRCVECGISRRIGRKMKPRDEPARMPYWGS